MQWKRVVARSEIERSKRRQGVTFTEATHAAMRWVWQLLFGDATNSALWSAHLWVWLRPSHLQRGEMKLCYGELSEPSSFYVRADSVNTLDIQAWYAAAMNAEEQRQTTPLRKHPKKKKQKRKAEEKEEKKDRG